MKSMWRKPKAKASASMKMKTAGYTASWLFSIRRNKANRENVENGNQYQLISMASRRKINAKIISM
jgi:hypothetical protein